MSLHVGSMATAREQNRLMREEKMAIHDVEDIQVGDVVQLTSGSPRMTVFAIRKGRAAVVWNHYPTGVVREQTISLKALLKTNPPARYQPKRRANDLSDFDPRDDWNA